MDINIIIVIPSNNIIIFPTFPSSLWNFHHGIDMMNLHLLQGHYYQSSIPMIGIEYGTNGIDGIGINELSQYSVYYGSS